jgi:hypothetical protein
VENHGKSTGRMLGFLPVSIMLNRTYKTGGYEQARNANFRQMTKTFPVNSSFGPKYFYGYG